MLGFGLGLGLGFSVGEGEASLVKIDTLPYSKEAEREEEGDERVAWERWVGVGVCGRRLMGWVGCVK